MRRIETPDGLRLEARWDDAEREAIGSLVFCHPHPLDGGSMHNPLMEKVTAVLTTSGFHVLRFNFRGVGGSEGGWDRGVGEIDDVEGAVTAARFAFGDLPLGLLGWSFGASTSLAWQSRAGSTLPWVGIAPGIRSYRGSTPPDPATLKKTRRLIILGDRDQFATVERMRDYADELGADIEILPGSDHFFWFREDRVGELTAAHFERGITPPG